MIASPEQETELIIQLTRPDLAGDLLKWVLFVYPWGQANTPLAGINGPRKWQAAELDEISQAIADNKNIIDLGELPEAFRKSRVSGRGPGKSALVAMLIHWMLSANIGSTTIVTANTEAQLRTKTWAEVGKWHTMAVNSHWFVRDGLSLKPAPWFAELIKRQLKIDCGYYYAQGQLWSQDNPDGFAGAHNPLGMNVIYDEASGVYEKIWTVTEGFFTEPVLHRYWHVFSNGRRPSGAFFETHHKDKLRWRRLQLDSRTVEGTDPKVFQGIIDKYGVDSDEARVEVYGLFPKIGERQFISRDAMEGAMTRELLTDANAPLIMGVDVARFGHAQTVIRWRQGRDARSIPPVRCKKRDSIYVENLIAEWIDKTNPDGVCIDAGNTGSAVCDGLKARGYQVHEVWFGVKSVDEAWADVRTWLYAQMRDWLPGGCLDNCEELLSDVPQIEYGQVGRSDKIKLESKEEMHDRGLASPDDGDSLACTFFKKFARKNLKASRARRKPRIAPGTDDSPLG